MARGSIVKRPSGNYAIVYYVGGKQKWETIGPSRREAERALTARKREVDTGAWREPSSETLASYGTGETFPHGAAQGFIEISSLEVELAAARTRAKTSA